MVNKYCVKLVEDILKKAKSKVYYFSDKKYGALTYYGIQAKKLRSFIEDDDEIVKMCEKKYSTLERCAAKLLEFCAERENYIPAIYIYTRIVFNKPVIIEELRKLVENNVR